MLLTVEKIFFKHITNIALVQITVTVIQKVKSTLWKDQTHIFIHDGDQEELLPWHPTNRKAGKRRIIRQHTPKGRSIWVQGLETLKSRTN